MTDLMHAEPMTITPDEITAFEGRLGDFARTLNGVERARLDAMLARVLHGSNADTSGYSTTASGMPTLRGFFEGPRSSLTVAE